MIATTIMVEPAYCYAMEAPVHAHKPFPILSVGATSDVYGQNSLCDFSFLLRKIPKEIFLLCKDLAWLTTIIKIVEFLQPL